MRIQAAFVQCALSPYALVALIQYKPATTNMKRVCETRLCMNMHIQKH